MPSNLKKSKWVGGLAEWTEGDTVHLSIAFTWLLNEAYQRAIFWKAQGYKVRAGGPGVFTQKHYLADVAELGGDIPDAIVHHNPLATFASRGCPVGCWFCVVPAMEGRAFTLLPDFTPRPILCDNNLSALPADYQDHIVARYQAAGVPLLDANSGFEPQSFDEEVYARWRSINKGPWRFAYDEQKERADVETVMRMLRVVTRRKKRVYVLIGNEPVAACMERIDQVMAWGGEPHVQPLMKLNALEKKYWIRHDWSEQSLRDVARWANNWPWHKQPWSAYRRSAHAARDRERYDERQGLFL